jgi:hypothetical protein
MTVAHHGIEAQNAPPRDMFRGHRLHYYRAQGESNT